MHWRRLLPLALLMLATAGLIAMLLVPDAPPALAWGGAAVAVVTAVVLVSELRRRQAGPLHDLADAARRLAAGEFGAKVYPKDDRFAELTRAFNALSDRLAERVGRLEDDLRQLRAVLSGMVEGVVSLDGEQRILVTNERAGRLLEFDPQAAVGRKFWQVVRHRRLQEIVAAALAGGEPGREELNWPGPAVRHLSLYVARLVGGPAAGAVLVLHDTSELRRLERVRQEFVANVSHELKTPLSVIKVSVETLLSGAAADAEHRGAFLEQIDEQADRLHALILDLLSLARIESGGEALALQGVPLERAVCDCLDRLRGKSEAKQQALEATEPAGVAVTAWADEEALDTILDNLVDNAIKYTPKGGRIRVTWAERDGRACLEVADTGIGIPERDQPRVFERFYRVDRARSRELGGTGLGLAIVKHLVQKMGGTVGVRSTLGKGTTFVVTLPLSREPARP